VDPWVRHDVEAEESIANKQTSSTFEFRSAQIEQALTESVTSKGRSRGLPGAGTVGRADKFCGVCVTSTGLISAFELL
jgi:hypothetical protein